MKCPSQTASVRTQSCQVNNKTKRKLEVQQLKLGMYVRELDRPWRETPFLFQGFEISSQDEVLELRRYCQHVYIDTPETYQKPAPRTPAELAVAAEQLRHKKAKHNLLIEVASHPLLKPVYHDQNRLEQEIETAGELYRETRELVHALMEDV